MAKKLGYTWYQKDWRSSNRVFRLSLAERGFYRELIDEAMLSDNKVTIEIDLWERQYGCTGEEITIMLDKLKNLKDSDGVPLIEINGNVLSVPSCEPRLNLIRGGKNGGEKSSKNKPTSKPMVKPLVKPTPEPVVNQIEIEIEKKIEINNTPIGVVDDSSESPPQTPPKTLEKEKVKSLKVENQQEALKSEYRELVGSLESKDRKECWDALRSFISDKKPHFLEPYADLWNLFGINYGLIKRGITVTQSRRNKLRTRVREPSFDFIEILKKIQKNAFLKGDNDRGWKVDFDFIVENDSNYIKILEEKYI